MSVLNTFEKNLGLLQTGLITGANLETALGDTIQKLNFAYLIRSGFASDLVRLGYNAFKSSITGYSFYLTRGYASASSINQGVLYATNTYSCFLSRANTLGAMLSAPKYSAAYGSKVAQSSTVTIQKANFATNAISTIGATIPTAAQYAGATGHHEAGFWGGGKTGGATWISNVDKINYLSETTTATSATLASPNRSDSSGFWSEPNGYGYFAGGDSSGGTTANIRYINFYNESSGAAGANLGTGTYDAAGGESLNAGFIFGGNGGGSLIQKLIFNIPGSESMSNAANSLSVNRSALAATRCSDGNYVLGGTGDTSRITKFLHSSESVTNVANTLPGYSSGRGSYGFYGGGGI